MRDVFKKLFPSCELNNKDFDLSAFMFDFKIESDVMLYFSFSLNSNCLLIDIFFKESWL